VVLRLVDSGRSVLVSSHVLSEVQQTVDDVVIINRGRLVRAGPLGSIADPGATRVVVRSPQAAVLAAALGGAGAPGVSVETGTDGSLTITGISMSINTTSGLSSLASRTAVLIGPG